MAKKEPLEVHERYEATVIKGKEPGKFPVAYTKTDGVFKKQIVFVGGDSDDLQPGQDILVEITKTMPRYAFGFLITPNDQKENEPCVRKTETQTVNVTK